MNRRNLIGGSFASSALLALGDEAQKKKLLLGYDNFALRAMGWKAKALIDHAVKLRVDTLFITDLDALGSLGEDHLKNVKCYADEAGIKLFLGTWSICPSSTSFKDQWGTADEHLQLGLRAAKTLGSPVLRVVLGKGADRTTPGGIEARIEDTVEVLKRNRSLVMDLGLKVAMENHAGDLHSLELKKLVEMAGPEFVGVNLDSGNAVWTLETPQENLENLGKYVLTTSLRDSQVWESENGVSVQWTAMGEGMVDWKAYFKRYAELCPNAPVQIETISGFNRELAFKDESFWKQWPEGKSASLGEFKKWAVGGKPKAPFQGKSKEETQAYQLGDIERSIAFCKKLGLGRKG